MSLKLTTAAWLLAFCLPLQAGEIALTFDDAPRPDSQLMTGMDRTRMLIDTLASAGVDGAIFFAIGSRIDEQGEQRLQMYQDAGHWLANHSHTHDFPHALGLQAYVADIAAADAVLRPYSGFINLYRFPYLNEGNDEALRDGIRAALIELDYRQGYVTIDNYDWYMEALLQQALHQGRTVDYEKLGEIYVELLVDAVEFYDGIAQAALGRSPRHVLLLHENDLAAMYVDDLVDALRDKDWQIVPGPAAYEDAIAEVVTDTLFNGQGRVAAIAETQGRPRRALIHQAEDEAWLEQYFEAAGVFGAPVLAGPPPADLLISSDASGTSQVFLLPAGQLVWQQLTGAVTGSNYPIWSPDGQRIAFQRRVNGKLDIFVMNADGSGQQQLTDHAEHDYLPSWTADGRHITFVSWRKEAGETIDANHIYIMNVDGSDQRRWLAESLGTSAGIGWSPDGQMTAMTRKVGEGNGDLFVGNEHGEIVSRLTEDERYNGTPAFSPDGQWLAFYSSLGDESRIEVIAIDGGERRVVRGGGRNWYPAWSPDGCWLVYTAAVDADSDANLDIMVMPISGEGEPRVLVSGPGRESEASWRPDPASHASVCR